MTTDLRTFMIFLHGPSGAGKGEMYVRLAEEFSGQGYTVHYASSGELFRAAYDDPVIAEKLRLGHYLDTLDPIMPRLQDIYSDFVNNWRLTEGRAVLILDGLIRRAGFVNQQGKRLPAQVTQVAKGFHSVHSWNADRWHDSWRLGPAGGTAQSPNAWIDSSTAYTIRRAWHILLDVLPQDAERQIRQRVDKAITHNKGQVEAALTSGQLDRAKAVVLHDILERLSSLVRGGIVLGADGRYHTTQVSIDQQIASELYAPIAEQAEHVRERLVSLAQVAASVSFATAFRVLGLESDIRDEDITVSARQARIGNYVQVREAGGDATYQPGFAAQTIMQEFGFAFQRQGAFSLNGEHRRHENRRVVKNGASRGVNLTQFQAYCADTARQVVGETEQARLRCCRIIGDVDASS